MSCLQHLHNHQQAQQGAGCSGSYTLRGAGLTLQIRHATHARPMGAPRAHLVASRVREIRRQDEGLGADVQYPLWTLIRALLFPRRHDLRSSQKQGQWICSMRRLWTAAKVGRLGAGATRGLGVRGQGSGAHHHGDVRTGWDAGWTHWVPDRTTTPGPRPTSPPVCCRRPGFWCRNSQVFCQGQSLCRAVTLLWGSWSPPARRTRRPIRRPGRLPSCPAPPPGCPSPLLAVSSAGRCRRGGHVRRDPVGALALWSLPPARACSWRPHAQRPRPRHARVAA